jgi:hypothetical protein
MFPIRFGPKHLDPNLKHLLLLCQRHLFQPHLSQEVNPELSQFQQHLFHLRQSHYHLVQLQLMQRQVYLPDLP